MNCMKYDWKCKLFSIFIGVVACSSELVLLLVEIDIDICEWGICSHSIMLSQNVEGLMFESFQCWMRRDNTIWKSSFIPFCFHYHYVIGSVSFELNIKNVFWGNAPNNQPFHQSGFQWRYFLSIINLLSADIFVSICLYLFHNTPELLWYFQYYSCVIIKSLS